ncbi:MAG TPA: hypoxanthine phosphoribosyltransferase [Saprospiraceae bacterium]|jgi:hypoxanthine phosphoribosyltransferase|nr:hypoxanthine phosphoribosyltransferase [Saprospiraceae bacterium]HRO08488.1 hypoxanthine phosphoribosyltransferase [Saprospiraceae bacterium]HRO72155.1 hypoxanthine phosphoribosyltransferase [Saprospiraceae bacterium]HRP41873.1 hypoxanthine phosphoribosyltransferase [Saprospiraceae bacterium]
MGHDKLVHIDDLSFSKYIKAKEIELKIEDIADAIREDFHDKYPMLLVVMNGAFIYAADLIRKLDFACELNFIRIKSYHGTRSTGKVDIFMPPNIDFKNRHVIIIEDIIDTGTTMSAFIPELEKCNPASISISSILVKPEAHVHEIDIRYPGFIIPNKFVVGYGLDYNGKGRNLQDIYQLAE